MAYHRAHVRVPHCPDDTHSPQLLSLPFIREKYVTRAEYDELKAKVDDLHTMISRLMHGVPQTVAPMLASSSSTIPMSQGPVIDPVQGTAITPYHQAPSTSAPGIYHTMIPPPRSPIRGEPPGMPMTHRGNPPARSPRSPMES